MPIWIMKALPILRNHWKAAALAGLIAFAGWQMLRVKWVKADLAATRGELSEARLRHAVTIASLEEVTAALNKQNERLLAIAAEGDRRMKASRDALARAREANAAQAGTIASLRASAGSSTVAASACPVSEALMGVEGL